MEQVSSFFKVENDIFYQVGKKVGGEKSSIKFVKNLLLADRFTIFEIANFVDVSEDFVLKVQKSPAQNNLK